VKFRFGNQVHEPDIRRLSDILGVIYDHEWLVSVRHPEEIELYYMYRDLALTEEDRAVMRKYKVRYDITIIPSRNLGRELVKTKGHCHPLVPGTSHSYTEVYEVLKGKAHYLLQKRDDVILVRAEKGDKVVIPPNYCHITVNPSQEELRMANWVSSEFRSDYEPIKEREGGPYFELTDGRFIGNKNYETLPELRELTPEDLDRFSLNEFGGMYDIIRENPTLLEFLNLPQRYY